MSMGLNGYRLGQARGTTNADGPPKCPVTGLAIWDKDAVMARLSGALYRHFGPYNTADAVREAVGRDSARCPKDWLLRTETPPLADYVRLYHAPGCGDPFHRLVMGLPEKPDLARAAELLRRLEDELLREGI